MGARLKYFLDEDRFIGFWATNCHETVDELCVNRDELYD